MTGAGVSPGGSRGRRVVALAEKTYLLIDMIRLRNNSVVGKLSGEEAE